ncbi:phenylacetate--CoA ligase family protein [Methanoculleus frigidifontis]|nr:AMP-binding protein [Methanoculleus sp. FWC-SCC1]
MTRERDPRRWLRKFRDLAAASLMLFEQKRMLRLPKDRIREIQERRFLAMVEYAYRNVPLYRKRWDAAGISPADIRTLEDIEKLPIITKADIRNGFPAETVSRKVNLADCLLLRTSGSAGEPCTIAWDRDFAIRFFTLTSPYLTGHYWGIKLKTATYVVVIGRGDTLPPVSLDGPDEPLAGGVLVKGDISFIDALEPPGRIIEFINETRSDFVVGYPGIMAMVAHHAKKHAIPVHSPKVVGLTAEKASRQSRALIEEVFRAPTTMCYATTETGVIGATQLSEDGYMLLNWDIVLELLDDDGRPVSPGETGSVVVTTLNNRAMPLIRYAGLADLASFRTQGCAHGTYLEQIDGRRIEALARSDGERINPYLVDALLADVRGIVQYQVIQYTLHDLEIVFVPDRSCPDLLPDWEPVIRQLGGLLGSQTRFRITPAEAIPRKEGCHKTPLVVTRVRDAPVESAEPPGSPLGHSVSTRHASFGA